MSDRQPMSTAPKDGRTVIVGDDDVGEYLMRWNPMQANALFPGAVGMWVGVQGNFTWFDHMGAGPSYWRNLDS
jgi:hypothetical protein